jgi:hypothetical protein
MTPIAEQNRRQLEPSEYAAVVEGTVAALATLTPPHCSYAVVSRGDAALLAVEDRLGCHFPRGADGDYAGHHPPDSAAAIAHLEELRSSGVRYLAIPASSAWWLDHYGEFADHLYAHYVELAGEGACMLFQLEAAAPAPAAELPGPPPGVERLARFLDALLPVPSTVLIAGAAWRDLGLPEREVSSLAHGCAAAFTAIENARSSEPLAYAVLPLSEGTDDWVLELLEMLTRVQPPLVRRDSFAAIFDLTTQPIHDDL